MKTKSGIKKLLIFSPTKGFLDGYDGDLYEWTNDKKTAWRLSLSEAEYRLEKILTQVNDGRIIENV